MESKLFIILLVSCALVLLCVGQVQPPSCYYSSNGYSCNTGLPNQCYGSCNATCVNGYCQCPNSEQTCQFSQNEFTCFDASRYQCCSNSFSHGSGALCFSNNQTCCSAFSISTCANTATQYCCPYATYAAACNLDQTCCGSQYPICIAQDRVCCDCGQTPFSCASGGVCNCSARTCNFATCSTSHVCPTGNDCCHDSNLGDVCYDPAGYHCIPAQGSSSMNLYLCDIRDQVCGNGICYNTTLYYCAEGTTLMPLPTF